VLGGAALVYLVGRLVLLLVAVRPPAGALAAPRPTPIPGLTGPGSTHEWGSVRSVGTDLFGPGLFPFEAISILLLVAVVGAIAIARPLTEQVHEAGGAGPEGAAR
jgi:NADH:ubiquinone oxidoreductase subunit 6 (subunit J)